MDEPAKAVTTVGRQQGWSLEPVRATREIPLIPPNLGFAGRTRHAEYVVSVLADTMVLAAYLCMSGSET